MKSKINASFPGRYRLLRQYGKGLSGLVYVHEHNTIHCDIKPDNTLMDGVGGKC